MPGSNFIIIIYHFFSSLGRFQYFYYISNGLPGKESVHDSKIKPLRLYIPDKRGITIDQHRFFKVNGLKKGIAESFIKAGICDEIRERIDIPERIFCLTIPIVTPGVGNSGRYQP